MNFYDVLAAEKWGGGIPTINFFDLLFAQSISGGQWETYEGTLPATLNANGSDMRQYQAWGNTGGVGDKTVQLFDKNATDTNNGYVSGAYIKSSGELQNSSAWFVSEYISVNAEEQYTVVYGSQSSSRAVCYYDINKNYISGANYSGLSTQETITTPSTCAYMRLSLLLNAKDTITVTSGTTPPETFVPFGYEVDMGVKSGNLLDYSTVQNNLTLDSATGLPSAYDGRIATLTPIDVSTVSAITITYNSNYGTIAFIYSIFTANSTLLIREIGKYSGDTIRIPTGGVSLYICWYRGYLGITTDNITQVMVSVNPSDKYQPYSNTTVPIYIGDKPLDKDEYVDYTEQKVYRRTVNLFDISAQTLIDVTGTGVIRTGVYLGFLAVGQYTLTFDAPHNYSLFITRKNGSTYTYQDVKKSQLPFTFSVNNGNEIIIRLTNTQSFEQQQFTNVSVTSGTTPPETYIPYYQPTDPPVPLPALPTCDGTTIVDYAGQSVAPEKIYLEYQGGK